MALTSPYGQLHYIGEFANDGNANTFVTDAKWDTNKNGTGTAEKGMQYFDTTINQMKTWNGSSWSVFDHGALSGLGDDDHTQYHTDTRGDARYYQKTEFKSSSVGAADAGKPVVLDAGGKIDDTMIDEGDLDHGALTGLGDDDHTQYIKADGTRPFTGDQAMGTNKITGLSPGTNGTDAINKDQLDQALNGLDWQESVLDRDLTAPPGSPSTGDRYIVAISGTGAWLGKDDQIAEWNGSAWVLTAPNEGFATWVEDEDLVVIYNGSSWVKMASLQNHNDLGNKQGGTTNEYYHLTSAEHTSLRGGSSDASSLHHHDGRYGRVYTGTALNPNGVQTGVIGDVYVSTGAVALKYMKTTASGNTGWRVI